MGLRRAHTSTESSVTTTPAKKPATQGTAVSGSVRTEEEHSGEGGDSGVGCVGGGGGSGEGGGGSGGSGEGTEGGGGEGVGGGGEGCGGEGGGCDGCGGEGGGGAGGGDGGGEGGGGEGGLITQSCTSVPRLTALRLAISPASSPLLSLES